MFSVEQVEYVRRIRSSGLSRDQVMAIWDRLDRIDAEFNQPTTTALPNSATNSPQISREFMQLLQQERNQQANALVMMQMQQLLTNASKTAALPQKKIAAQGIENSDSKVTVVDTSSETVKEEPAVVANPVPTRLVDESDTELVEFLRKNSEPSICEQIRQFIALNGIKQHQVAVLVGTSQSYISKYLKADYLEMSERSRRNIYRWYVTYRNQPARAISDACAVIANPQLQHSVSSSLPLTVPLSVNSNNSSLPLYSAAAAADNAGTASPAPAQNAPGSPRSTSSSSGGNNHTTSTAVRWNSTPNNQLPSNTTQRRFRFTFRAQQLAILERAFSEDTYPTVERREELARQLSVGLDNEHAVSLFTVTNWFANRRKEAKRAAVEEGLNVEELGMKRGRGRPSILHRMASAQLRETRQGGSTTNEPVTTTEGPKEPKRPKAEFEEQLPATDAVSDGEEECESVSSAVAGEGPDDLSSASAVQRSAAAATAAAELAVFPAPELIAS